MSRDTKEKDYLGNLKIGILGAGQLGRMFALEAARFGIHPYFLDRQTDFPAGLLTNRFWVGDFTNKQDVLNFGRDKDILTIEIENVNTEALKELEEKGVSVYPSSELIDLIKDKGLQKDFYRKENLPTSPFQYAGSKEEILKMINEDRITFPFVQKSRTAGYDGKGVQVIQDQSQLSNLMDTPSIVEEKVQIKKELATIVARNKAGEIKIYPTVDMVFDHSANLVDYIQYPAMVEDDIKIKCHEIAENIATKTKLVGLLAIEFFLNSKDEILINEMAPRTHNSGHITMEACDTSQFEQQLRAIYNLPLGSTEYRSPAIMINLLGPQDYFGPVRFPALQKISEIERSYLHLYGKSSSKPKRKLGHINILGNTIQEVHEKMLKIKGLLNDNFQSE